MIGKCGNSGRSPVPHLHFQVQTTPSIGSKTIDYPLGQYILHAPKGFELKSHEKPGKGETISNIEQQDVLEKAFHFIPGQKLKYEVLLPDGEQQDLTWEVMTDPLNYTYIYCQQTKSKAYFRYDGDIHYFTHFEGKRDSILFYFFLGGWKAVTGFYKDLKVNDTYPVNLLNNRLMMFLQDFIAPFRLFLKADYSMTYLNLEDDLTDAIIELRSSTTARTGNKETRKIDFEFRAGKKGIERFRVTEKSRVILVELKSE